MPRKKQDDPTTAVEESLEPVEETAVEESPWSQEELLEAKRFGPAIVGEAMYRAALEVSERTSDGRFGPALL